MLFCTESPLPALVISGTIVVDAGSTLVLVSLPVAMSNEQKQSSQLVTKQITWTVKILRDTRQNFRMRRDISTWPQNSGMFCKHQGSEPSL